MWAALTSTVIGSILARALLALGVGILTMMGFEEPDLGDEQGRGIVHWRPGGSAGADGLHARRCPYFGVVCWSDCCPGAQHRDPVPAEITLHVTNKVAT